MSGSRLLLVVIPLYPVALHLGVSAGTVAPGILVLSALLLLSGIGLLMKRAYSGWGLLVLGVALLACQIFSETAAQYMLFLPPILINLLLGFLFARTLSVNSTPLISSFARMVHGHELDEETLSYTRTVTWLWSALFFVLALESLFLALFAPLELWSLFTNFINYLLVLLFFIVEYQIRIRRLSYLRHPGFFAFMRQLGKFDIRSLTQS